MATYYVRTTGNDTTGDGSTGAPWASLHKALATVSLAGGHTILVGDGTYTENSGSGYLNCSRSFSATVAITPEGGANGDVTVTNASGTQTVLFGSCGNLTFNRIKFLAASSSVLRLMRHNGNVTNLAFTYCTFTVVANSSQVNKCYSDGTFAASSVNTGLSFSNCTFQQSGTDFCDGLALIRTDSGVTLSGVTVTNCTFNMTRRGVQLEGVQNLVFTGNRVLCTATNGSSTPLALGTDNALTTVASGVASSGTITGNIFSTVNGHGVMLGAGISSCIFRANVVIGGNNASAGQGLVIKEGSNISATDNLVFGGYLSGIYIKGAQSAVVERNVCVNLYANSPALRVEANLTDAGGANFTAATIRHNRFVTLAGSAISYNSTGTGETGASSVVDYNVHDVRSGSTWGNVRGTTVSSLATVQAAWSGYGDGTNSSHSIAGTGANAIPLRHSATAGSLPTTAGPFIYRVILNAFGQIWNGTAFADVVVADWYKYAGWLVEGTLGSYFYTASIPLNLPAGDYTVVRFVMAGAGPAISDTKIDAVDVGWDARNLIGNRALQRAARL